MVRTDMTSSLYPASITYYENRRRGYVPLSTRNQGMLEDDSEATSSNSSAYRIAIVGDYKSGVSTVRSEFIRMSCTTMPDFGDCARSISVSYGDRNLELWLFMDTFAFQEYFESLSAPVDCCIACYSSADNETVESLLNRWLPLFYEYFPHRPAIVCELIDCNAHENSVWPPNWKEIFANVVCQMEISVFEKVKYFALISFYKWKVSYYLE
ncbi:unnamed protein product [Toxocara canis]|uniref:Ras-like GTP-binding protein RhoL n=1 Tax=Toxocara canis TaxID=6265 RepID=A0A183V4X3_TOXCA|nr:unnamed protein product [Toxocara canis]